MPIVGSFAGASARAYGASAGVLVGDFESIQTITVGTAVSSVSFTSIPQTYTHLQIRWSARASTGVPNPTIIFNGNSGANYSWHYIAGDGANAQVGTFAGANTFILSGGVPSTANIFSANIMDIFDYSNTNKFKTSRELGGYDVNGSGGVGFISGNFRSTTAITSIEFAGATFQQYSSFALYGMKA